MTDRELMQQALEALNRSDYLGWQLNIPIIKALRERLAQPEQEPVAWGVFDGPNLHDVNFTEEEAQEMMRLKGDGSVVKPLYTDTQPQMQPCAGRNCGSTNPNLHSAECFEDYEKSTGMVQEPIAWVYQEGLEALKGAKPWTAYGSSGDGRIPLYLDAVARRVEPPAAESGAGFESLPASPTWWDDPVAKMNYRKWQGLTADEIWQCNAAPPGSTVEYHICMAHQNVLDFAEAIEAKLRERNT